MNSTTRARLAFAVIVSLLAAATAIAAPGDLDPNFAGSGFVVDRFNAGGTAMLMQPDGNIVIAGTSAAGIVLVRHRPDGSLDSSFGMKGVVHVPIPAGAGDGLSIRSIARQLDGKLVIGGLGMLPRQISYTYALVRVNANGSIDESFNGGGANDLAVGLNL